MHILILGKNGQLGWETERVFSCLGTVMALDYPEVDLLKLDQVIKLLKGMEFDIIINATAYTAVDKAEDEPEKAFQINSVAPGQMAQLAKEVGAVFIHYSTDYVFNGEKDGSYTEDDIPDPLNLYGRSKLLGEKAVQEVGGAHLILRTSWLYSLRGDSFVRKVMHWARTKKSLRVVSDQIGSPTWARLLAESTALVVAMSHRDHFGWFLENGGLFHLAGSGSASRQEWAKNIISFDRHPEQLVVEEVLPARTEEFPTRARRPLRTVMNSAKFKQSFGISLPDWTVSLKLAMDI
jgi:dTDP-4-dehydrorhamnose reductase